MESRVVSSRTTGNAVGEMGLLQGSTESASCVLVRWYNTYVTSDSACITVLTFERLADFNVHYPKLASTILRRVIRKFLYDLMNFVEVKLERMIT
eukprot:1189979-Prorocentrum_minimum.AAC.2